MTAPPRRFAWVLNLDAELELSKESGYNPGRKLSGQLAAYGEGARALLGPEDVLVTGGAPRPVGEGLVGRAWCPTPLALAALERAGARPEPHPDARVLRDVNHRRFSHELGGGLPGQAYVEDRGALDRLLDARSRPLLLKRPLAFAGRGQLRILDTPTAAESSWIDASLRADGLVVEPLVAPTLECGLHGFVRVDGSYALGRPVVQDVSNRGVFRAVRLAAPDDLAPLEEAALRERADAVARALAARGYFGPFGIDAYRYALEGRPGFCALSEINARYTMGFATGFPVHPKDLLLDGEGPGPEDSHL